MGKIEVFLGDITKLEVDAIVNAANTTLLGGGGVDGAIHNAAGPELLQECRQLNGCRIGEAKITKGYKLPVKHIIHTVGPLWQRGISGEPALLKKCYENSLQLARVKNIKTIAFPSISTGLYRYPIEQASKIAVNTVREFLKNSKILEKVIFVCFTPEDLAIYKKTQNSYN